MRFEVILYRNRRNQRRNCVINSNDGDPKLLAHKYKQRLRRIGKQLAEEYRSKNHNAVFFSEDNPCVVTLTVSNSSKRKFDPDNLQPTLKAIMDGFTDGGLWTDDNCYVVKQTAYRFGGHDAPKGHYKLEIEVEEGK